MLDSDEILSTIQMFQTEHLDVRAVTLGLNLGDCADHDLGLMCRKVARKISRYASRMVEICDACGGRYGIQVTNKRLAVSAAANLLAGHGAAAAMELARTLDAAAAEAGIDFVGGFSAMVHKSMTPWERMLIESLPETLTQTQRLCSSINVASRKSGVNMDAVKLLGVKIREIAAATADSGGFGAAKLVVFANIPEDSPFMAGAYLGPGEGEAVVNIGVSGPGVVSAALKRLCRQRPDCRLNEMAEEIKTTAFRVTRAGELIGREVAAALGVEFGIVDLSLAPTPQVGDSVGEILQDLGIAQIGAPGSTAAVAMLNDAVKKGGAFASSSVGGLSGAFIPVSEDAALSDAARRGHLSLEKLEAMTSVCSVGLDMVAVPGDTPAETLSGIIADEMAIGVINNKTTAVRIIPVPGGKPGDVVDFGGLFGSAVVMEVRNSGASAAFVNRGGRIPAPIQSLGN